MPVVGRPIGTPPPIGITTETRIDVLTPEIPKIYGDSITMRKRGFALRGGTRVYLMPTIYNSEGEGLPLIGEGGESAIIRARFVEAVCGERIADATTVETIDEDAGIIRLIPPEAVYKNPGIYLLDVGVFDITDTLYWSNEFFVYVEASGWTKQKYGPPAMDMLRMSLRDSDPRENELLDDRLFGTSEIAYAAVRAVQHWNELPPFVASLSRTSRDFTPSDLWLSGIRAFLFELACEYFRKNSLPYSAGGVTIDDNNRLEAFSVAFKQAFELFHVSCMRLKAQINTVRAYGYV